MTFKHGLLGIKGDDRYRNVAEAEIIEILMIMGWAHETQSVSAAKASGEALQSWIRMGLEFRCAPNGERLFDPVEVGNFMKRAGVDGLDGFWADRYVSSHRRRVTELAEACSSELSARGGREFTIDFKRTFNLRNVVPGTGLRLRAPLPIEGDYLQNLEVTPVTESVGDAQLKVRAGTMEMRMIASGEAEVHLGAKVKFTSRVQEPTIRGAGECPEKAIYLCDREGLIFVSERIRILVQSLAGIGASPLEAARAFWEYINDEMMFGSLHYDQIDLASPCDWLLDSGWSDCKTGATLFVALCRAFGLPARLVGGYLLYPVAPGVHYWAEVWMEDVGWMPFDFLGWDLSMGGRDREWRDRFFGRLEYRLTCERLPREFCGPPGVQIPPAWYILQVPRPGGMEIKFVDAHTGTPVYADTIRVTG